MLKICSKCGENKDSSDFRKDKYKPDGLYSSCKSCKNKALIPYLDGVKKNRKQESDQHKAHWILSPTKYCGKCEKYKPKSEFSKSTEKGDGLVSHCKSCLKTHNQDYYLKTKERHAENDREWRSSPAVREHRRLLGKTRYKSMKAYGVAIRRAVLRNATPKWLTLEQKAQIKSFYKIARHRTDFHEIEFEVDHIEPLIGKTSCGLMVPWNLRVIEATENRSKGNKLIDLIVTQ